jgi:GrpB-like predicted nucleotidyltransferase (UPF0157 family)
LTEYPHEVTQRFHATAEQLTAGVVGGWPAAGRPVVVVDYDPGWADRFAAADAGLRAALGDLVCNVEHVGSTSIPGLAAKPIVDIDLLVTDADDEAGYRPALERLGYRLVLREPWWYGHRMLVSTAADVNLHVWPQGAPEPVRHRLLRDWLRSHPEDRELYASAKRRLARDVSADDYSLAKSDVIDEIFTRIFAPTTIQPQIARRAGTDLTGQRRGPA